MSALLSAPRTSAKSETVKQVPFGAAMAAYLARRDNARRMADEMSLQVPANLSDWQVNYIERQYAEYQTSYNAYLEERAAEIAGRDSEHAEEMGRIEQFA